MCPFSNDGIKERTEKKKEKKALPADYQVTKKRPRFYFS